MSSAQPNSKNPQARAMTLREWGLMFFLSVLWGGSFIFVEMSLEGFAPFQLAFLRVASGAVVLIALITVMRLPLGALKEQFWFLAIVALFTSAAPFALITWGQTHITAGVASIINASTPIFGIVLAHFFTSDEKLSGRRLLGVIIGFIGVFVLIGPEAIFGTSAGLLGMFAGLAGTFCYGIAGILGKKLKNIPPLVTAGFSLIFSSIWLLPVMLVTEGMPHFDLPLRPILALLALGVLSTALAYVVYFRLIVAVGASNIYLVTLLIPATSLIMGNIVLGEIISTNALLGFLAIAIGLLTIDGRLWERFKKSD